MSYCVNEEPVDSFIDVALATLNANRSDGVERARFEWLYKDNPQGQAIVWSVRRSETGDVAGFTSALPRWVAVEGELRPAWNCADFSMHPKHRTLGPAIRLRRAAREGVDQGRVEFLYAHPNPRMAVIHNKVGHQALGRMVRMARVLRTAPYLRRKLKSALASDAIGAIGDQVMRLGSREFRHRCGTKVDVVKDIRFDDRFDALFDVAKSELSVVGVRDAAYLNWRYADNPLHETDALLANEDGELRGYLLFFVQDGVVHVKDAFPPHDMNVMQDLVVSLIRYGQKIGAASVSFALLESSSLLPILASHGFRQREDCSEMYVYAPEQYAGRNFVVDKDRWALTVGDRDV